MKVGLESCGVCSYTTELNNRGAQRLPSREHAVWGASEHHKLQHKHLCWHTTSVSPFALCVHSCVFDCLCQYSPVSLSFTRACQCVSVRLKYVWQRIYVANFEIRKRNKKWGKETKHPTLLFRNCFPVYPQLSAHNNNKSFSLFFHPTWEYFTICVSILTNPPVSQRIYLHVIIPKLSWKRASLCCSWFAKSPLDQIAKLAELHYNTKSNCI